MPVTKPRANVYDMYVYICTYICIFICICECLQHMPANSLPVTAK